MLLLSLTMTVSLFGNNIESCINSFNKKPGDVKIANAFFAELSKEEFIDDKVKFTADTPRDSVLHEVWYWSAEWYYYCHNYEKAKGYANKALPYYRYDSMGKLDCLNLLAIINVRLGELTTAATYGKKCLDVALKKDDASHIASCLNTLAGIYFAANHLDEAESYNRQGREYAEKAGDEIRMAILLGMASEISYKKKDYLLSLKYAREAYRLDSIKQREPKMAIRLSQIAMALAGLNRKKEAEATYRKAIASLRSMGNVQSLAIDLNQLGMLLVKQKRVAEAKPMLLEAEQLLKQLGDSYNLLHSYEALYEVYWEDNPDSSKVYLNRFNALKDSIYSTASAEVLARYDAEFGNSLLKEENQNIRVEKQVYIIIGILIILAILLLSFVVIYILVKRNKQMKQSLLKEIETIKHLDLKKEENDKDTKKTQSSSARDNFLRLVVDAVHNGLESGDYNVAHIASALNMSEQTFRRRLREVTGESPKVFISAIQMKRASEMLITNPDKTITEIAAMCGFVDASAFSHTFKRVYGCAPSQYRMEDEKSLRK